MSTALAERMPDSAAIEQVLVSGDLTRLTPDQRVSFYNRVCQSLGLNPLTKPFAYLTLNGKMILYALKDCTEQLRKLHGVSITELTSQRLEDVFVVTAKANDKSGRTDAATGAVPIGTAKGETLANLLMKAETKAKRRVTLSICGLGMLDETELDTIPNGEPQGYTVSAPAAVVASRPASEEVRENPAAATGEIRRDSPSHDFPSAPAGTEFIRSVKKGFGPIKGFVTFVQPGAYPDDGMAVYQDRVVAIAEQCCQHRVPVTVSTKTSAAGKTYITDLRAFTSATEDREPGSDDEAIL